MKRLPVFSAGWIAVSAVALVGLGATWLFYPIEGACIPEECPDDNARLLPAVIGTIVVVGTWVIATLLRRGSRPEHPAVGGTRLLSVLIVAAALLVPEITLFAGGFTFPLW